MYINISYKLKDYTMRIVDINVSYPDRKEQQLKKDKEAIMPESVAGTDSKDSKQRLGSVTPLQPVIMQESVSGENNTQKAGAASKPGAAKNKK
jgi:hypothetical protein